MVLIFAILAARHSPNCPVARGLPRHDDPDAQPRTSRPAMKSSGIGIIFAGCALILVHGNLLAAGDVVLTPAKRQEVLDGQKKLLASREVTPAAVDPFHSEKFADDGRRSPCTGGRCSRGGAEERPGYFAGDRGEPETVGKFCHGWSIHPVVRSKKRVKAGERLTITFEGTEYTLEITAIERTKLYPSPEPRGIYPANQITIEL